MSKIYKPKDNLNTYALVRDDKTIKNINIGMPKFFSNKGTMCATLCDNYSKEDLKEIIKAIDLEEKRRKV